jgi:hypothetical protein
MIPKTGAVESSSSGGIEIRSSDRSNSKSELLAITTVAPCSECN